ERRALAGAHRLGVLAAYFALALTHGDLRVVRLHVRGDAALSTFGSALRDDGAARHFDDDVVARCFELDATAGGACERSALAENELAAPDDASAHASALRVDRCAVREVDGVAGRCVSGAVGEGSPRARALRLQANTV